jgi:superfamily II DNA or RNA helicase
MSVKLTEKLLSTAAGWQAMKQARAYLEQGQVLSSYWAPPLLRGVVQTGEVSFRASAVIAGESEIENLCTCRDAREWGKVCAHIVAVGLHWIQSQSPAPQTRTAESAKESASSVSRISTAGDRSRDSGGEPAELLLILPPNMDQAITRGKIMVVFEARWSGGRAPLNALPPQRKFSFSDRDHLLLERVESFAGVARPGMIQLSTKEFSSLLPVLSGHPNISLGRSTSVQVHQDSRPLPLLASLEANGEIVVSLKDSGERMIRMDGWSWSPNEFRPFNLPRGLEAVLAGSLRLPRALVPQFLNEDWPRLSAAGGLKANFKPEDFTLVPLAPRFSLELQGGLAQITGVLQCAYGTRIMTVGVTAETESVWIPDPASPTRYSTRDPGAEHAALARLQRQGFTGPDSQGRLHLNGQNACLNFFARELPRIEKEWRVTLEERLDRSTRTNLERIEPRFEITSSGVQWFDLGVVFASSSGQTFSQTEIQRLLLSGQGHTRLKNGKMALIDIAAVDELQETLRDCSPEQGSQGYRIHNRQAGFLESTIQKHQEWQVQAPNAWRERVAKQTGEATLECPPLGDLDSVLRPYQKAGVAWLRFLRENGFGGILADEMGLGKTLQTLAFLRFVHETAPRSGPALIVCPTSLVFNWLAEARKFTPSLRVMALQGPDRFALFERIPEADIVLTSYALIRRDAERYRGLEFDTVVLDEAQHIKNRQTENAQAVKAVRCQNRLVLTGTPLENSVLDLWSIYDFLMPGYLGTAKDFRERYELPITREKDQRSQERLARRLRPFLLRRLKRDVATDLPARLEQVSYCVLTAAQQEVYQQVLETSRKEILENTGQESLAQTRMMVLTALLRLRQTCCDLRLLDLRGVDAATSSGKLELFSELLEEVIDGGHRVLVFSQFVSMLTLLRQQLETDETPYCYLDGSTPNRGEVVERFQKDPAIPVFLISLKAGGVGLNLTGADTVIHFDPWWNPAVEDQATDRAHRIGQTRVVTSYKLITRDTVEEKILTLQSRKREIIQGTIGGEEEFTSALTWDEIQELLR